MKPAADNLVGLIGNTPLVRLGRVAKGIKCDLFAKLEYFNPGGSVKDRIGISMIEEAESKGLLKPGMTIIEPTSGNTGVGLALAATVKGYRLVFTIPDKMSAEKINLLRAYGGHVVITPVAVEPNDPRSYYRAAEILRNAINGRGQPPTSAELAEITARVQSMIRQNQVAELAKLLSLTPKNHNCFIPNQYANPANPSAHYKTTGPEIWRQTEGKIDAFIVGVGTGGTVSGTGKYLKEQNPKVKVIGIDTVGSLIAHKFYGTQGQAHPYLIEGIGEDFIPDTLDLKVIDEIITVSDKDAYATARELARQEAILVGSSSGAAVFGALQYCRKMQEGQVAVVLLPDGGRSYLSKAFNDEWLAKNKLV
ncbi:MAG: pyridoxal-phosphate dependent enzyme [Candidatus Aenigmarchaeota archaeon]|nr:pyridoxal-phosphate dependent enzyme [Candidatus Aenigmarchaeota archaeon]